MKSFLHITFLTTIMLTIVGCASQTSTQTNTMVNAHKKPSFPTIHDKQKQKKYSSPVGNKAQPQAAPLPPGYTAPNENPDFTEENPSVPGAITRPGTHSAFTE